MRGNTDIRITSFYVLNKPTLNSLFYYFYMFSNKPDEIKSLTKPIMVFTIARIKSNILFSPLTNEFFGEFSYLGLIVFLSEIVASCVVCLGNDKQILIFR